jgi:hypothetical protein
MIQSLCRNHLKYFSTAFKKNQAARHKHLAHQRAQNCTKNEIELKRGVNNSAELKQR